MLINNEIINQIRKRKQSDELITGKVGATIKLKRRNKHQTLNNLSELFGVSISYLSKVENDLLKPNIDYLTDVLEDLEINEKLLNESLEMNGWYTKLVKHILNIKDYKEELNHFINGRDDFQSKIIEFSLLIYENKFNQVTKHIRGLIENIHVIHQTEVSIFMMSLATYYIKVENHFAAGELIKELIDSFNKDKLLELWLLEIKYELALYQSSFTYFLKRYNELSSQYYLFNLRKKLEELRERSLAAFAYFLEPDNFLNYLDDEDMYRSYRLSHVYFGRYEDFDKLEKQNDLAQLLIDEFKGNYDEVKKKWPKVEYKDDPFEQAIKEYFKYKYDYEKEVLFLRETLFAGTGQAQHYYCSHFLASQLNEHYCQEHKYKQCYLLSERMKKLDFMRKSFLKK